jgi:hypothetical protein
MPKFKRGDCVKTEDGARCIVFAVVSETGNDADYDCGNPVYYVVDDQLQAADIQERDLTPDDTP